MTRIDKSPEMLDAEAANRAAPLEERDLSAAIELHRQLFQAETGILRLHSRDGETAAERGPDEPKPEPKTNGWPRDLKQPYSAPFAAFLDERYGGFPWHRALMYLRYAVCRKTHTKHWERDAWRGSLCHELVSIVIRQDRTIGWAQRDLGLPEEGKTRRTLDSALLVMERKLEAMLLDERANQAPDPRPPSEWMAAAHVHRPLDGLHRDECPQCARAA